MLQNEYISKDKINIVVVLNKDSNEEFLKNIFSYIKNYLNIDVTFIHEFKSYNDLKIGENKTIDFFFVDFIKEYEYIFAWNFYAKMHELNKDFKLILLKEKIDSDDIKYFKNGADDIIFTNNKYYEDKERYLKWKFFSLLRRKWDDSHSKLILNRNGVIIDLLKRTVIIDNKEIKVTSKEFEVLAIMIDEFHKKNNFSSKNKIFKKIYGIENDGHSRGIDQIIFRLKNKFPENFFEINKKRGIRII